MYLRPAPGRDYLVRLDRILPNGSPVFWSITAYYFGAGTYFAPNGYGFIGIEWFFMGFLVALLLTGFLVIITQNQQPTDVHKRPRNSPE